MTTKTIEQPAEVICIFDNEGYSLDQYTISVMFEDPDKTFIIATSARPYHPAAGVWSIEEDALITADGLDDEFDNSHIGKEIQWEQLPYDVQEATAETVRQCAVSLGGKK